MITYIATVVAALVLNIFIFWLLRRGILQEKFAALWLLVAAVLLLLAVFPGILSALANWLNVVVPANLLFFLAGLTLLAVSIQLSFEIGRVEGRTRRLAEDLALLRTEISELRRNQTHLANHTNPLEPHTQTGANCPSGAETTSQSADLPHQGPAE